MNPCVSFMQNKRVCVALSGGQDSMALLFWLLSHREELGITLSAVHCEHGLRGEASLKDAEFVRRYCDAHGIPLYLYSADCGLLAEKEKCSVETAARNFRYRAFAEVLQDQKADCIALAHHANDNAETVLINLCRGASLTGASGIPSLRERFVRPLLSVPKSEIVSYVAENDVPYVQDDTNFCTDYTRNHFRWNVIPEMEKIFPEAVRSISRFSEAAREDDAFLYSLAEKCVVSEGNALQILRTTQKPLFRRASIIAFKKLSLAQDYALVHLDALYALQNAENGKRLDLPCDIVAFQEYGKIVLQKREGKEETEYPFTDLYHGVRIGDCFIQAVKAEKIERGVLDFTKLPPDTVVRTRRTGDTFLRFGGFRKSLSDYLTDQKIPLRKRDAIPLLCSGKEVLVVCGMEISETVRADGKIGEPACGQIYKIVKNKNIG